MKATLLVLAAAGALATGAVQAQSGEDVFKAKGCVGCHDVDKKKMGPSLKDIAAKHKGAKDAEGMLVAKIKDGKGHPKSAASEAEIKAAVAHVLATK